MKFKYSLPYLIYIFVFGVIPVVLTFFFVGVGIKSALSMFSVISPYEVLYNTFYFALFTAVFSVIIGYILAITADITNSRIVYILAILPFTIPFTSSALIWLISLYGGYGWFSYILGLKYDPLYFSKTALTAVSMVSVWSSIPIAFLIILASLRSIPKEIKEASQTDGLTLSQYYLNIAFPYALKGILLAFLMNFVLAMGNFDLPYVMTQGGPGFSTTTLPLAVYDMMFDYSNFAGGAFFAIILAAIASIPAVGIIILIKTKGFKISLPAARIPDKLFKYILYVVTAIVLVFLDFPVYWMVLVALRPPNLDFHYPPILYPKDVTYSYIISAFKASVPYLISSIIIGSGVGLISVFLSAPAAYESSRNSRFWTLMLSIYLYALPSASFVIPIYIYMAKLNLLNTWWSLILASPIFTATYAFWMMFNYYLDLPKVYEEAAEIDGMKNKFLRLILPLSRPFMTASFLLSFIFAWHLLFYPLVLSDTPYNMRFPPYGSETITIFALNAETQGSVNWGLLASSALIAALPVIILSYIGEDYILRGVYSGGVKGV
ncbi:MAG: ABC transporter permease subunit [Sulfolobaceae archaeon]|nr:ABC transporter permease subunit [Sulfolobaceae archaeon]